MRLLIHILVSPLFFLCSFSEPASQAVSQTNSQSTGQVKWRVQDIDPASAQKLLTENSNIEVLDVRTPGEFAEGHIEGALNVDFKAADFADKVAKLDKSKSYVLHCRSGNRSGKSLATLKDKGFGTIYHLNEGFNAWKASGMPTVR